MSDELMTLYRPVGQAEFDLIRASGFRHFPPRLPQQPFFYPVLNEEYATQIARDWNTKDEASGFVGYVTRFAVSARFLSRYPVQKVGGAEALEYWVPAGELDEFNRQFGRRIVWVPWQRPGFELALMLRQAVQDHPGCDGIILGGHGLFTWGATPQDCYLSSIRTIDQMGEFIRRHEARAGRPRFGGAAVPATVADVASTVAELFPHLRRRWRKK